jgi:diguanylate cyclase (GGDEF)-like protein
VLFARRLAPPVPGNEPENEMSSEADVADRQFTVDALTGLSTRRPFAALAEQELERHRRAQRPLSLLIANIDSCKRINMCRGYPVGDRLIVHVADLCLAVKRGGDIVARVGGDYFAILLPETDLDAAAIIAERLRRMVETTPLITPEREIAATVSIGIAQVRPGGDIAALMAEADAALHEAKRAGRNRVAHATKGSSDD